MNRKMTRILIALFCASVFTAGCAKKEMIRSEEPVAAPATAVDTAPTAAAEPAELRQPATDTSAIQEETIQDTVIETAPVTALKTVYFDFDSYVLSAEARDVLRNNAEWMLKNSGSRVQIQGNCDERGSAEYNLALGENRAKAALRYLTTLGIDSGRLSVLSYGKEKPAVPGNDEAAWAKNRRADFAVIR